MITLNTDSGLVEIGDWNDLTSRPAYRGDLDPATNKLKQILGHYIEREMKPCGLSNCHTPHAKGYYVTTENGLETNIGKDCGKKYLNVDFEAIAAIYHRDVANKTNRQRLWAFTFRLDDLDAKIDHLRRSEADHLYRTSRTLVERNRGCPEEVRRRVREMVKNQSSLLSGERDATEEEIEAKEFQESREIRKRPLRISYPIAEIAGLPALYAENDLRNLLVIELQECIAEFKALDIDSMSPTTLTRWTKWADTVDAIYERAQLSVVHIRRLIDPENLRPFLNVLDGDDEKMFRNLLQELERVT